MKMVKAEFENIAKHKILTATICAMMIIPFLYSVFFLKSVWDPYGNTGHLPVAVVNKAPPVKFQSKNFVVGDQLVDQLRVNDDLDLHFVSAKKAQYGLSHKKYYMVITIPENFSKVPPFVSGVTAFLKVSGRFPGDHEASPEGFSS